MSDVLRDNLVLVALAVVVAAIILYFLLKPRQRVQLSESTPLRPHMAAQQDSPREGNGIVAEAAAAAGDVSGQLLGAPVHEQLGEGIVADDFQRMKGVGPKFAQMLQARGFFRFEQVASLTPEEIERLDPHLGAFRGRVVRDRLVEQAAYLARGDQDGFERNFGRL